MIVKILSRGRSFKGLTTYLTHDPKAETTKRVAWTHTVNLANDHVASAVDEMLWTSRNAELLKQEAGIRAGGRATENAVKHLSLNWSPEDSPTREHMIETTEGFLRHMNWHEHQALLVAHQDRAFPHVHVMLNVVNSNTGLRLDDHFERRRAQAWALDYEKEQGRIYCEQRMLNVEEREDAPTRPAWMAFENKQQEFERDEKLRRDQEPILIRDAEIPRNPENDEWKKLKELQRHERQEFFADGKWLFSQLRRSICREVREKFRERWSDFYAAEAKESEDSESDALTIVKEKLLADQKAALDARRDEACRGLKESRDGLYRELLDDQRACRHGLRWRQEAGLDNALFFEQLETRELRQEQAALFQQAGEAATRPDSNPWNPHAPNSNGRPERDGSGMRSGVDAGDRVAEGLGFGLLSIFESIADGIIGSTPAPKPRPPEPDPPQANPFDAVIADARKRQQHEQEQADEEYRRKQRSLERE